VTPFIIAEVGDLEGKTDVRGVISRFFDCRIGGAQFGDSKWDGEDRLEIRHGCGPKLGRGGGR